MNASPVGKATGWKVRLLRLARGRGRLGAFLGRVGLKCMPPASGDITVELWGRPLLMEATHHLPYIIGSNPMWGMPLVHCVGALESSAVPVEFADIGANIGDSVALLESGLPGRCRYHCFEPDPRWRHYCEANTRGLPVTLHPHFVGEGQALSLERTGEGTAGARKGGDGPRSLPLDELFREQRVDFIKIDTDGFDFAVLRSGGRLLAEKSPALFFEWDPVLWHDAGEDPAAVFAFLRDRGYADFLLFTDGGWLQARTTGEDAGLIRSLVEVCGARRGVDMIHWDIFAAPTATCDRALAAHFAYVAEARTALAPWNRLGPKYWS